MALILWQNWVSTGTLSATGETTPVERVRDLRPARAWHGVDQSDTVTVLLDGVRAVTHVALVAHNLGLFGTVAIRLLWAGAVTYEQTLEPWDVVDGLGFDPYGERLGGYPDTSAAAGFAAIKVISVGGVQADTCEVTLTDATLSTPVALGHLFAGVGQDFVVDYGWSLEWQDTTTVVATDGGGVVVRDGAQTRLLRCRAPDLAESDALGAWDDLVRVVGVGRPVIVQLLPDADDVRRYRTTIYGMRQSTEAVTAELGAFSSGLTIKELR